MKMKLRSALLLGLLTVIVAGCSPSTPIPPTAADPADAVGEAMATIQAGFTQTAEAIPPTEVATATSVPSPTAVRTPPALPGSYQSNSLNPLDTPHTYIDDTCEYLRAKWDPNNSVPGTVVMIVMIHSITSGTVDKPYQINAKDFRQLADDLHAQGFEAINMQQLADFMESNAKIPARAVMLLVDDRHYAEYFNTHFRPLYEKYGWSVVNGYISKEERQDLWDQNAALSAEGWVDYQAHGVIHNIPMSDDSSDDYLVGELQGSVLGIQQHFGHTPIGIIWPGGGFGVRPVQFARQYGYRLGFTTNPRGPIMFNWVPQADAKDEGRPYFIAEGPVGDPLMTLPRYTDTAAGGQIDTVRIIGKEAAAYAEQNKAVELDYYDIMCAPTYGAMPTLAP